MTSILRGIGSYVPEKILDNKELSLKVETSDDWIRTRTGIRERRIASPDQPTSELALNAARNAIEAAQIQPDQIDLVIVATITPDMA
ncbi:MAG: 3-oxoacyl-ACP synthase, partial [Verrucomicrobia bacterium TMED175]